MKKLNWGIIGLGAIAQQFSKAFVETSNSKLLAVASHDFQKLDFFKKQFRIEEKFLYNNYEDLINCRDIDIVYIALPNSLHFQLQHSSQRGFLLKRFQREDPPLSLRLEKDPDASPTPPLKRRIRVLP